MTVVIPMSKPADIEERAHERAAALIASWDVRLQDLRVEQHDAHEYPLPLPWYAHENSRELELIVAHFRPEWREIRVRRGVGCLELVFME